MPRYMLQVSYTPEAWAAMVKKPQDRLELVRPAIEKLGGKLIDGYFAFGEYDLIAILDMPNNVTAAAFSVVAAAGGACSAVRTTVLMTSKEAVDAMGMASRSGYRPPTARAAAGRAAAGRGRAR